MNRVLVTTNGPLECHGELDIVTAEGALVAHETETWLCRCGRSATKPFCDGSHKTTGFVDSGAPPTTTITALADRPEAVRVTLRPNGPLKLEGPCEVSHPVAGVLYAGIQTALCRCGQSKTKPFCDGTHRQVEFVA